MKIAVILNYKKNETVRLAEEVCAFLTARECELQIPEGTPGYRVEECRNIDFSDCQLVILLGGDGTLLGACHLVQHNVPLLTVNMGKMGFLTEVEKAEIFPSLEQILQKDYSVEELPLLDAEIRRDGECIYKDFALNDFVLDSGSSYRSMSITTEINGEFVSTHKCSGLIFSSPTGSTAYAISAGGPVIMPQTKALLLTHIAAHSLYARPIVTPEDAKIRILFSSNSTCRVIADGQFAFDCETGDEIFYTLSDKKLKLVKLKPAHFFTTLNNKLVK